MSDGTPYDQFPCGCGATTCRGHVTGDDWARPELWERYRGYFSPYLQRRIDAKLAGTRGLRSHRAEGAGAARGATGSDQVQEYEGALDRGLEGVVTCTTSISTIEGTTLLYRGYTIEDLAKNASFEEVVYLLWYGWLPTRRELDEFCTDLHHSMALPPEAF